MASLKRRGDTYYAQWYVGSVQKRASLETGSLQIAKERLRQMESRLAQGDDSPLPTRTPIGEVVAAFIEHMKAHRPDSSWRKDLSYLRDGFGPCCPELEVAAGRARKCWDLRCPEDRRRRLRRIDADCFESVTTAMIADMIADRVRVKGLSPKTANRYREVFCKLFNWAMDTGRVRLPRERNPAAKVARYRERAPEIRFLTLAQIDEQLRALEGKPVLRALVATYIYAGLRREEALRLTAEDIDLPEAGGGIIRVRARTIDGESWQPKTARNRAVPLSSALRAHLTGYRPPRSDHGWFFPSPTGTRWDRDNMSADLREANAAAGLPWACLDYRHTFGSQLAQKGVSLFKIATMMGNSPEICRRHYAALVPAEMHQDVEFSW